MPCLDDTTVDDLMSGRLEESQLRLAEAHLDECPDCSALVSTLAGGGPGHRSSPPRKIGRHEILETLGRGAMGIVYLAFDPELQRRVALKLIRPDAAASSSDRLLREAQAMARLAHPNVAAVHEVGREGDDVYISMEYVAGRTLRELLQPGKRSGEAILGVLLQAAEGLAAIHAADLVHRDFKPENVIVGDDGRVRVTDLGLATSAAEAEVRADGRPRLVGTPAYMAPEQLDGREATERSDQFALALTIYEALAGRRPFEGSTPEDLRRAIERGPSLDPLAGATARLRRAVARALSPDPGRRFSSIQEFAGELRPSPRSRRSIAVASVAIGALAATAIAALSGAFAARPAPRAQACDAGASRVAEVWSAARADRMERAFTDTKSPLAPASAERVSATVSTFVADWEAAYTATCEAHLRGEQSMIVLDARMRCLDRRLSSLGALLDTLESPSPSAVAGAPAAALELPQIDECESVESLLGPDPRPTDPAVAERLAALEEDIAKLRSTAAAGLGPLTPADASALVDRARRVGHRPTVAEAELLAARVARRAGAFEDARRHADEAQTTAEAARADGTAARAWLEVLAVAGASGRFASALENAPRAEAAILRIGDPPALRAGLSLSRGLALASLGRLDEANEELERALSFYERTRGAGSIHAARALTALGDVARLRGKLEDALSLHARAREIDEAALGPEAPATARHHHNIAGVLRLLGRRTEALASYERALSLEERLGAEHPSVGLTENSIGITLVELGRVDEARARFERADAILARAVHPDRALVLLNLARVDASRGDHAAAIVRLDDAIVILQSTGGKDYLPIAGARLQRGRSARSLGRRDAAKRDLQEALRIAGLAAKKSAEASTLRSEIETELDATTRPLPPPAGRRSDSLSYGSSKSWDPD